MDKLSDSEVREAVTDLGRTFFVEASAGTGKTHLLCDRALAALLTPGYEPSRLVAITFTEKAAAELSARLRATLEAWAAGHPDDEQAAYALERFDQAQISTIHSFATSLLRELPVEAAVDPAFQVLDEVGKTLLFEQAWEEWLQAEAEREDGAAPWSSTWGHFGSPRLDLLEDVVAAASAERDIVDVEHYDVPAPDPAELRAALQAARARFAEVRDCCLDRGDACYRAFVSLDEVALALDTGDLGRACSMSVKPGGAKKNWKPAGHKDDLNENYLKPVQEAQARLCDALRRAVLPPLIAWLAGAARSFQGRKEESGDLDFHDLLLMAVRLLRRRDAGAREYFQRRYRHILVDEFQDTDPLQVELIFFLAEGGAAAREWRDATLVPGKLFVVGDPKQSIYRFRRADIEVYEAARDVILRNGGEVLRLTDNFRTAPDLVSFVNSAFGGVFGEGDPPYQPAYGLLNPSPHTRERQRGAPAARVLEGPAGAFESEEDAAEAVAAFLRRAVEAGEYEVYDKEAGERRPLAYRDVALLFRRHKNVPTWEAAFERWEVPFYTLGGRTFYVRREVKAMAVAARALDNPADQPALAATLMSPLFSFTADELLRFKRAGGVFDYREKVEDAAPPGFAEAFNVLKELHDGRADRSPAATLALLVERAGLLTKAALWGDGPRAVANVRKVLASARTFARTGGVGLRAFARWLVEMAGREEAEHESPALEAGDDFVRLLTVHKAKGLEFNAVVFVDWARGEGKGGRRKPFVDRRTGLLHVLAGRADAGTQLLTPGYEDAAVRESRFGEAEERRLDYVAATRARDLLVLPLMAEAGEDSLADTLGREEVAAETVRVDPAEERRRLRRSPAEEVAAPALGSDFEKWEEKLAEDIERAGVPEAVVAATALACLEEEGVPSDFEGEAPARPDALKLGSALHAVMEEADLAAGAGLEELAAAACAREGLADADAAAVETWARACLEAAPVREAADSPACYRELRFAVAVEDVVVTGTADLVYETAEGLVVVDYKTDEGGGTDRAKEKYFKQMAIYAAALRRVTGQAVARAYLVLPRGAAGERVVEPGTAAELLRRGEELLGEAPRTSRDRPRRGNVDSSI